MIKAPTQPKPPSHLDAQDVSSLTTQLMQAADELARTTDAVAQARTIREYDSDRRKRALAERVREFIIAGDSAAAAETKGRASVGYGEDLDGLQADLIAAEKVIAAHDALLIRWKSLQSTLSCLKQTIGL